MAIMTVTCNHQPDSIFEIGSCFVNVQDPSKTYGGLISGYEMPFA